MKAFTTALAAACIALGGGSALAHSWYDGWCCDDRDCAPYPASQVSITEAGYELSDGTLIPFSEARTSQDQSYHRCVLHGRQRCFYAPPMGF